MHNTRLSRWLPYPVWPMADQQAWELMIGHGAAVQGKQPDAIIHPVPPMYVL